MSELEANIKHRASDPRFRQKESIPWNRFERAKNRQRIDSSQKESRIDGIGIDEISKKYQICVLLFVYTCIFHFFYVTLLCTVLRKIFFVKLKN